MKKGKKIVMKVSITTADTFGDFIMSRKANAFYDLICMDSQAERIFITGKSEISSRLETQFERMCATLDDARKHLADFGIPFTYEIEE